MLRIYVVFPDEDEADADDVFLFVTAGFGVALTVITQAAFSPFGASAVIVAVPADFAVTFPVLFTVATLLLLEYHFTFDLANPGDTVAVSVLLCPTLSEYFL